MLGQHPLYRIGLGMFVVMGLVICSRMEYGRGVSGIEVLEREPSPDGAHEYVVYRTYEMSDQWWHLAVVLNDNPLFTEPQHQVMRLEGAPGVSVEWRSNTELQVTLPPTMAIDEGADEPATIDDVTISYVGGISD